MNALFLAWAISASVASIGTTMNTGSPVKLIIKKTITETIQRTSVIWIRRLSRYPNIGGYSLSARRRKTPAAQAVGVLGAEGATDTFLQPLCPLANDFRAVCGGI